MKFLKVTLKRTVFSIILLLWVAVGMIEADPADDFSFTLRSPQSATYLIMSEANVVEVFSDRLHLFPQYQIPKLAQHLLNLCHEYQFDPAFILSLIEVESAFKSKAVSSAGAVGLMQMMPSTAQILGQTLKEASQRDQSYSRFSKVSHSIWKGAERHQIIALLKDPFVNLELGVAYLAWLRDRYSGRSPFYLVAAYNIGPSKTDELLSRKQFKPVNTKRYYEAIRRTLPQMRYYRRSFLRERNV